MGPEAMQGAQLLVCSAGLYVDQRCLASQLMHGCLPVWLPPLQVGLGRTGKLWGHEHSGVQPDMMTLAKPLAGRWLRWLHTLLCRCCGCWLAVGRGADCVRLRSSWCDSKLAPSALLSSFLFPTPIFNSALSSLLSLAG
jgi:hypothetical protein